jgi:hypothetical protein
MSNLIYVKKKRSCKRATRGALLVNLEGVRSVGLLKKKNLGSFSWSQRTLKVNSGGHLEL